MARKRKSGLTRRGRQMLALLEEQSGRQDTLRPLAGPNHRARLPPAARTVATPAPGPSARRLSRGRRRDSGGVSRGRGEGSAR